MTSVIQTTDLRANCHGILPLPGRLEPWMRALLKFDKCFDLVKQFGSPVNVIAIEPLLRNAAALQNVASDHAIEFRAYFARKANKCLAFVNAAIDSNCGIDTASENEVLQCLSLGVAGSDMICTAAVKSERLVRLCLQHRICIVVDNSDELELIRKIIAETHRRPVIALRLGGFEHKGQSLLTRFGFDAQRDREMIGRIDAKELPVGGVHFHLDGYDASQRVSAIAESLRWVDELRLQGHPVEFIDMGGGFPMSYIESGDQWDAFWEAHRQSLLGQRDAITYRRHGLGCMHHDGRIVGRPNVYPFFQSPVGADWFSGVLSHMLDKGSVAAAIRNRGLELRCEPGRSLLDGCGVTMARVEFCKQNADDDVLVGLSMNRTQCRTTTEDFLVDPIVLCCNDRSNRPQNGYLVGAYCTESELISLRKLQFPNGIQRGDLVAFPNTAGYLMHFLESRSHQFSLATNLVWSGGKVDLDAIDKRSE